VLFKFSDSKLLFWMCVAVSVVGCGTVSKLPTVDEELAKSEAEKQRELAVEENESGTNRLYKIGYRVLSNNAKLCEKTKHSAGIRIVYTQKKDGEFKAAIRKIYDLGNHVKIVQVVDGSPGSDAGLQTGDEIVAIDSSTSPTEEDKVFSWFVSKATEMNKAGRPYTISILRNGNSKDVSISPEKICHYPIVLEKKDAVNAAADGNRILVSTGMMRFAVNDNDLALVVGHELAHNTMLHIDKGTGNRIAGAVIGAVIGALIGIDLSGAGADLGSAVHSQEFESEADYVGVYYAARAGFDITNVAKFWRKMAANHPRSIHLSGSTHPSSAKRFIAIEKTKEEIRAKEKQGLPLIPEKEEAEQTPPKS